MLLCSKQNNTSCQFGIRCVTNIVHLSNFPVDLQTRFFALIQKVFSLKFFKINFHPYWFCFSSKCGERVTDGPVSKATVHFHAECAPNPKVAPTYYLFTAESHSNSSYTHSCVRNSTWLKAQTRVQKGWKCWFGCCGWRVTDDSGLKLSKLWPRSVNFAGMNEREKQWNLSCALFLSVR